MFSFTSSDSREQIAAALEFSYNGPIGGVDGFAEAELRETLSTARIEIFALGGPNTGVQNLIREGNLAAYFGCGCHPENRDGQPVDARGRRLRQHWRGW